MLPEEDGLLSTPQVIEEMNNEITYRQLDHWVRLGFIHEHGQRPGRGGSGITRTFDEGTVQKIRTMAQLVNGGIHARQASLYADEAIRIFKQHEPIDTEWKLSHPNESHDWTYILAVGGASEGLILTIDMRLPRKPKEDNGSH
jgi:hypothetical protein